MLCSWKSSDEYFSAVVDLVRAAEATQNELTSPCRLGASYVGNILNFPQIPVRNLGSRGYKCVQGLNDKDGAAVKCLLRVTKLWV